jgi:hypothetical protein
MSSDQLKGARRLGPFENRRFAEYCAGSRPQLRVPRKDSSSRDGEQTVIRYAPPSHGKITTRSGRSRATVEAERGKESET